MVETTNLEKCQEACNQRDGCRSFARCVLVITIAWLESNYVVKRHEMTGGFDVFQQI